MLVRRKLIQLSSVLVMFALVVFYFLSILTSRRDSSEYVEHDHGHSIMSPGEEEVIITVDHSAGKVALVSSSLTRNDINRQLPGGLRNEMNRHLQPSHDAGVVMATVGYSASQVTLEPSRHLSAHSQVEGKLPDGLHGVNHLPSAPGSLHGVNHLPSAPPHDEQSGGESRLVVQRKDRILRSAAQSMEIPSTPAQRSLPGPNDVWHPHRTRRLHVSDYAATNPTPPTTTSPKGRDSPRVQHNSFCFGKFCMNAVESSDRQRMFDCVRKALEYVRGMGYSHRYAFNKMQCSCELMNGAGRKRFGLVSLPGSGNTWVRGLLEKATGVCTGSMWCDRTLRSAHFCGEGMRGKSLLLVKNHDASLHWSGENGRGERQNRKVPYDAMIFLHRNPFDAIVAEWNRAAFDKYQNASAGNNMHTASYGPDMFRDNPEWNQMVLNQTSKWMLMMEHYIIDPGDHPVLVVRFEDLKRDTVTEVKKMLDFLEFPYSEARLEERLQKGYTQFLRSHDDHFEHYTKEQTAHVNKAIRTIITRLRENDVMDSIGLPLYLRT